QLIKIERLIEPVCDMFSAIFFVAIGLMIDPQILLQYAWPIAVITVAVVLGAFLIGAIMAESRQLIKIERLIEPVCDMFSAIFFVAIGLMIDPQILLQYAWPIAVITVA
ncbi:cation:proton antiporter, partial [Escherichia coli]|uniref:cation:proton antiporter domain-containing protein n=1 Tax=Escherichia coli TaxID=562 RepID=UPI00301DD3F0